MTKILVIECARMVTQRYLYWAPIQTRFIGDGGHRALYGGQFCLKKIFFWLKNDISCIYRYIYILFNAKLTSFL